MKEEEKTKRQLIFKTLFIVITVVLVFGIGSKSVLSEAAQEIPKEIRVGDIVSFTGPYATFGINSFGVKAAFEDVNKEGGVYVKEYGKKLPVRYIVADNESDATKAATLAEDLIVRDKVHVLTMGGCPMPLSTPVNTVAERYKLPFIGATGIKEQWIALREEATPPWVYNWGIAFAVVMPYPPGSIWDKPGYTLRTR